MVSIEIPESLETRIDETLSQTSYKSREELIEDALKAGLKSVKKDDDSLEDLLEKSHDFHGRD